MYPFLVTLFIMACHFALASGIGYVLHSYVSVYASYFLVLNFRYAFAINNFAYLYTKDPQKIEKVLRDTLNKKLEKRNEHQD